MFSSLSLSKKVSLLFGLAIFFIIVVISIVSYWLLYIHEQKSVLRDLKSQTTIVSKNLYTTFDIAVKSYLKGIADQNLNIVKKQHQLFLEGRISRTAMMTNIRNVLLAQKIGETGYNAGVSSTGILSIHPKSEGVNISRLDFWKKIQKLMKTKNQNGYLEYMWKNKGEEKERAKAAWIEYYKPLDLIIWISSYRNEFLSLIDKKLFKEDILSVALRGGGYYYAMDEKGILIIHPQLEGKNLFNSTDANGKYFIKEMLEKKNGTIEYMWKNHGEKSAREKIAVFQQIKDFNWILVGGVYVSDLTSNLMRISIIIIIIGAIFAVLGVGFVIFISSGLALRITAPVKTLQKSMEESDLTVRLKMERNDEIGQMAHSFNVFLENLHGIFLKFDKSVSEINSSTSEMSKASNMIADSSQKTTATAEEVSSTIEEMSESNKKIYESIEYQYKRTSVLIENINLMYKIVKNENEQIKVAEEVKVQLDTIISTMKLKMSDTLNKMNTSRKNSTDMVGYVSTIYDISEQINLLALNASIEAARAGDSGRGFAVVAEEIGKLASQVDQNTKNISATMKTTNVAIDGSSKSLEETVQEVEKILLGLEKFGSIVVKVGELTNEDIGINEHLQEDANHFLHRAQEIMKAIDEERKGLAEILRSAESLYEIAFDNSTSSRDLTIVTDKLINHAKQLKIQMDNFKL